MKRGRSTVNDGLKNKFEGFVLTNFKLFWLFKVTAI